MKDAPTDVVQHVVLAVLALDAEGAARLRALIDQYQDAIRNDREADEKDAVSKATQLLASPWPGDLQSLNDLAWWNAQRATSNRKKIKQRQPDATVVFWDNYSAAKKKLGLRTPLEVSQKVGLSPATVQQIEAAKGNPLPIPSVLEVIERGFGLKSGALLKH